MDVSGSVASGGESHLEQAQVSLAKAAHDRKSLRHAAAAEDRRFRHVRAPDRHREAAQVPALSG